MRYWASLLRCAGLGMLSAFEHLQKYMVLCTSVSSDLDWMHSGLGLSAQCSPGTPYAYMLELCLVHEMACSGEIASASALLQPKKPHCQEEALKEESLARMGTRPCKKSKCASALPAAPHDMHIAGQRN